MHRLLPALVVLAVAAPSAHAAETKDTTAPILGVPKDVVYQQKTRGAIVRMTYRVVVDDDRDPAPRLRCIPPSGSRFRVGTTTVRCTAEDAAGNVARASFRIIVKKAR